MKIHSVRASRIPIFRSIRRAIRKCRYFMPNKLQAQLGSLLDYTIHKKKERKKEVRVNNSTNLLYSALHSIRKNANDNCVEIFKCTNDCITLYNKNLLLKQII